MLPCERARIQTLSTGGDASVGPRAAKQKTAVTDEVVQLTRGLDRVEQRVVDRSLVQFLLQMCLVVDLAQDTQQLVEVVRVRHHCYCARFHLVEVSEFFYVEIWLL